MTVGELKKALEAYPDDMEIVSYGPDCGGYDGTFRPLIVAPFKEIDEVFERGAFSAWPEYSGQLYVGGSQEK